MYSWKLFSRTIVAGDAYKNPVYLRELNHDPVWYRVAQRITLPESLQTSIIIACVIVWTVSVLYVGNLLFFFVPPLVLFVFGTALAVGPIIAEERTKQSWETLLTVPLELDVVLLGKLAGALWWMRHLTSMMSTFIFVISAGAGFVSLILIPIGLALAGSFGQMFLCGALILLPFVSCTIFILDRIQHYMLMVAAALATGTLSRSGRTAFASASVAVLLVWVVEVLLAGTAIAFYPGAPVLWDKAHLLLLVTAGPTIGYVLNLPPELAGLYLLVTLIVREVAFGVLWRLSVRNARFEAFITM